MIPKEDFIEKLYEMSSETVLIPPDKGDIISCKKYFGELFTRHGIPDNLADEITETACNYSELENSYMFRRGFIFGAGLVMDAVYSSDNG